MKGQARRDGAVDLRKEDGADADGRVEIADHGAQGDLGLLAHPRFPPVAA